VPDYKELLDKLKTPIKYDSIIISPSHKSGEFDSHAVDTPFVFRYNNKFYMTFIGWDSIGYRTGLASSTNLIHWENEGIIINRGEKGSTTQYNAALSWILRDNELYGNQGLKKVHGKYIGSYHSYPRPGYEGGSASIGLCLSSNLRDWVLEEPFFFCTDGDDWEKGGLYKSCIVKNESTYYMFYNAKNRDIWPWKEQIGLATSNDLKNWSRYEHNPVIKTGKKGLFDDIFAADPSVYKIDDTWVMFYYGLSSDGHARNSVAFSKDLIHWDKSKTILVDIGTTNSIDSQFAHKPSLFYNNGTLYHYYCAVSRHGMKKLGEIENIETRGIAVAMS